MTFSLVARSGQGALLGVVIASSSPAVAARCLAARSRVGAVASQNITDPALRETLLEALARGSTASGAVQAALASTPFGAYRQLLAIGMQGPPAVHSGARTLGRHAAAIGADAAAAGNLLAHERVPEAMLAAFETSDAELAEGLLAALRAGAAAGGEEGPVHSAGLLIVREVGWPIVDLRIDWSDAPIADLEVLWRRYAPQLEDYVVRARDPTRAPSFKVPGDR